MIVTFYANRGGVGRTMALANVAAVLASAGFDVVVINWDLHAPGIGVAHYFLDPAEREQYRRHPGMGELLHEYKQRTTTPWDELSETEARPAPLADIERYLYAVRGLPHMSGSIHLMGPWHQSGGPGEAGQEAGAEFGWFDFYKTWRGYEFFEWLRQQLAGPEQNTFILIDAPAGDGVVSRVLTRHLADLIVLFCAPNNQNIEGLEHLLSSLARPALRKLRSERPLNLLVVPSRITRGKGTEAREFERQLTARLLEHLGELSFDHRQVRELAIPQVAPYGGLERLAFLERLQPTTGTNEAARDLNAPARMLASYIRIALVIAAIHSCRAFELAGQAFSDQRLIADALARHPLLLRRQLIADYLRRLISHLDSTAGAVVPGSPRSGASLWQSFAYPDVRPAEQLAMQAGAPDEATPLLSHLVAAARLLVLGEPGLGKSWFCQGMAYHAAHAALGKGLPLADRGAADEIERWLRHKRLIPLMIQLRALGPQGAPATAEELWRRLETAIEPQRAASGKAVSRANSVLAAGLRSEAAGGRVLWLLDGLDELDEEAQQIVRDRLIAQLEQLYPACPIVLTCRTGAYRRLANPWQNHWRVVALQPMKPERQLQLLQRLFTDNPQRAEALLQQIAASPVLKEFASSPLHLRYLAAALRREEPPASPTQLHWWSLNLIVRHLEDALADELRSQEHTLSWNSEELPRFLALLGHRAQLGRLQAGAMGEQRLVAELADSLRELAPSLPAARTRAQALIRAMTTLSSGVFQRDAADTYQFTNTDLQLFLAGRYLASGTAATFIDRARAALDRGHGWGLVVLQACVQLLASSQIEPVLALAEQLLGTGDCAELHCLADILSALSELPRISRALLAELRARAAQRVLEALSVSAAPGLAPADAYERAQLGRLLDRLGSPTSGVRGDSIVVEWRTIAAGDFWVGSDPDDPESYGASRFTPPPATIYQEAPPRQITLPGFRIARHPVTNAQWRRYLQQKGEPEPTRWLNPRLNGDSQPVVGVSWGEAHEFCAWMSATLGFQVFLPSEAQWERAARGVDKLVYPWGNQWEDHANTAEASFGAPSVVGSFPAGASPEGVEDLVGNVLEWTASPWEAYSTDGGTSVCEPHAPPALVVARGGSWNLPCEFARGAARIGFAPDTQESDLGFRLAAVLPPG